MRKPFSLHKRKASAKGRGVYYCQYWDPEEARYATALSTGATSRAAAEAWAHEHLGARDRRPCRTTLEAYAEEFWNFASSPYVRAKLSRGKDLCPAYCDTALSLLRNHALPRLGKKRLAELTTRDVEFLLTDLRAKLAAATVNHLLSALKVMFKEALRSGLVRADPCAPVERFRDDAREKGIPTKAEVRALFAPGALEAAWNGNRAAFAANLLAACTGMRQGEVLGLRRGSIGTGHLAVEASYDFKYGPKKPKYDSKRVVPLPSAVREVLLAVADEAGAGNGDLVFARRGSSRPMEKKSVNDAFYAALASIGVAEAERKERNISFHSWRHFFNTACRAARVPDGKLRRITGHRSEEMTEHYTHFSPEDFREVEAAQAGLLGLESAS